MFDVIQPVLCSTCPSPLTCCFQSTKQKQVISQKHDQKSAQAYKTPVDAVFFRDPPKCGTRQTLWNALLYFFWRVSSMKYKNLPVHVLCCEKGKSFVVSLTKGSYIASVRNSVVKLPIQVHYNTLIFACMHRGVAYGHVLCIRFCFYCFLGFCFCLQFSSLYSLVFDLQSVWCFHGFHDRCILILTLKKDTTLMYLLSMVWTRLH